MYPAHSINTLLVLFQLGFSQKQSMSQKLGCRQLIWEVTSRSRSKDLGRVRQGRRTCVLSVSLLVDIGTGFYQALSRSIQFSTHRMGGGGICLWALIFHQLGFLFGGMENESEVVTDSATPWTVAYHAPPSMGFSRQEYWSGVPLPSRSKQYSTGIKTETQIKRTGEKTQK